MKNLKRLLCLALTGVMLSGMMVMGAAAADFTDADEIVNVEAVDTMVALSIINGKPDGSYDPNGLVTRAEMAKMIATAVNGGVAPEFGTKPTPTYTDIKGNWAEQYIEYCYDMKYISGRGNGIFDPAGNVTGVEAAKMVLTALGYDETAYQLKGADWAINTNAIAIRTCKPSLYDNLNGVNMNVAITRDTAAQIIWNGVQNHIVEWTPNREVTGTGLNYQYTMNPDVTLLNKAYDAYIWVGTFNGNDKFGLTGLSKGEIQVEGALEGADRTKPGWAKKANFPAEYDIANIGEETKVIFKDGKSGPKKVLDRGDKIYGVFNTGASVVYNVIKNDIADGDDAKGKIKVAGTVYDVETDGHIMTNYDSSIDNAWTSAAEGAGKIEGLKKANGDTVKLIANSETGRIEAAYVVETKLAVVTSSNADKITMNNLVGTVTFENNDVEDGLKKDDVVAVTRYYDASAEDGYTIVKKAEVVTGEVTGFKNKANDPATKQTVSVDGTAYKIYNETTLTPTTALDKNITFFAGSHIGETVNLYLANGFVYLANQVSSSATNYSVVLEAKDSSSTGSAFRKLELHVMNGEGEKTIISVSEDTDKKQFVSAQGQNESNDAYNTRVNNYSLSNADFPRGSIITYDLNKNGEAVVYMKAKFDKDNTTGIHYNKDTKVLNTLVTDPDCVVFVNVKNEKVEIATQPYAIKGEIKAYKIRDLGTIDKNTVAYAQVLNSDNTKVLAAVLDLRESPNGASSNRVYGIVSKYEGTVKVDGVAYTKFTVDANDEQHTLYMKANNAGMAVGSIVTFEPVSDSIYADTVTKVAAATGTLSPTGNYVDVLKGGLFVKEYNESDSTLTVTNALDGYKADGTTVTTKPSQVASYKAAGTPATYVVNSDTKFYYVNQDKDNGVASGSVEAFDQINGYANVMVLWEQTGDTKFAKAVIVETSGKAHIVAPAQVSETPTVAVAGGTDTTLASTTLTYATTPATTTATGTYAHGKTPKVQITVTGLSAAEAAITVDGADVKAGTDVELGTGIHTVNVTVKETGKTSKTFTYKLSLTMTQSPAPANP